jgi:SAM-dependent methyltransferase
VTPPRTEFDGFATAYDSALQRGLSLSGENREFFARQRVLWLARVLGEVGVRPARILDYGCGTGIGTHFLSLLLQAEKTVGIDVSKESLEIARTTWPDERLTFLPTEAYHPDGQFDLAFCNGVFHHIGVEHRLAAARYLHRSLRPGAMFSFWENNPWNPATRIIMRRIPFDREAKTLSPLAARDLVTRAGFQILRTDFCFIFPLVLSRMRWMEAWVCKLPLGAQYQVLCRRG